MVTVAMAIARVRSGSPSWLRSPGLFRTFGGVRAPGPALGFETSTRSLGTGTARWVGWVGCTCRVGPTGRSISKTTGSTSCMIRNEGNFRNVGLRE